MDYSEMPRREIAACMIADLPNRERPRERLTQLGPLALSDTELLAVVLRSGRRGTSVIDMSRQLLGLFDGDLLRLSDASQTELCQVPGIGPTKAVELRAAFALSRRVAECRACTRPVLQSPMDVCRHLEYRFEDARQEEFHVLLIDTKHRLLRDEVVTLGLVDRTQIHPREVFRVAIREASSRILLVHNHPSGDPTPSSEDISSTKQLVSAGKIIGIDVLDHVIVGKPDPARRTKHYVSFREENLLK